MVGMLNPRKHPNEAAMIVALARGATQDQVAKEVGVSRQAITKRLTHPEFAAKVERARQRLTDSAIGALASAMQTAVDVLVREMKTAPTARERISAAVAVLNQLKYIVPLAQPGVPKPEISPFALLPPEALTSILENVKKIELQRETLKLSTGDGNGSAPTASPAPPSQL